jgi:hypothetical protein
VIRDDGCVVYLNGVEVARSNMPGGAIAYDTLASSAVGGADESAWQGFTMSPALLVGGVNVVAVEVHQSQRTSSDLSFDLRLEGIVPPPPLPAVSLVSPADGATVNDTTVSFDCAASDPLGLLDATLYTGGAPRIVTFSGPGQSEDAEISAATPGSNLGGALLVRVDGQSPHAHTLLRFPGLIGSGPGQVPPGARVIAAELLVSCSNPGDLLRVYRLTEDWVEGQATWNERSAGVPWTDVGADGPQSHGGVFVVGDCKATGQRSIDLVPLVQEWSDGAANHGVVLTDTGPDGVQIDSSESASPPVLRVTYSGSDFLPVETRPLSGTSENVTFTTVLADQQSYVWNVLVTNTSGQQSWAPADFLINVDTQSTP